MLFVPTFAEAEEIGTVRESIVDLLTSNAAIIIYIIIFI